MQGVHKQKVINARSPKTEGYQRRESFSIRRLAMQGVHKQKVNNARSPKIEG